MMAEFLLRKSDYVGLKNNDEKAYIYVTTTDPTLQLFELYDAFKDDKQALKEICIKKFGIYDPVLISLERMYVSFLNHLESINEEKENGR